MPLARKAYSNPEASKRARKLFERYQKNHDSHIRDKLLGLYLNLVHALARKYTSYGEPLEDLAQVGSTGLIKAIERYDLRRGISFTTYAVPTITGEIKRYLRDKSWFVKGPRRLQELNSRIRKNVEEGMKKSGRSPLISEIAEDLDVSEEEVLEALEIGKTFQPLSLDAQFSSNEGDDKSSLSNYVGLEEKEFGHIIDKISLEDSFRVLGARERIVIRLRFYDGLAQSKITKRLHLSQMQISRIEHQALKKLKKFILDV